MTFPERIALTTFREFDQVYVLRLYKAGGDFWLHITRETPCETWVCLLGPREINWIIENIFRKEV